MSPHGNQEVADPELIDAVDGSEHPVASTAEVATICNISRTAAGKRLLALEEEGKIRKKDIGQAYDLIFPIWRDPPNPSPAFDSAINVSFILKILQTLVNPLSAHIKLFSYF